MARKAGVYYIKATCEKFFEYISRADIKFLIKLHYGINFGYKSFRLYIRQTSTELSTGSAQRLANLR